MADPLGIAAIVRAVRRRAGPAAERVDVGIVCGSGLAGLSAIVEAPVSVPYDAIPAFPRSTVAGHGNELVFGRLGGHRVVVARGRFHYYEGHPPAVTGILPRVFAALGARVLVVTNAAGGVNPAFNVGDVMLIRDHISFPGMAGVHPLVGANDSRFGPRFPAVTNAYDATCAGAVEAAAEELGCVRRDAEATKERTGAEDRQRRGAAPEFAHCRGAWCVPVRGATATHCGRPRTSTAG
jgi:purine nucleoside phosphorylase